MVGAYSRNTARGPTGFNEGLEMLDDALDFDILRFSYSIFCNSMGAYSVEFQYVDITISNI